MNQLLDKNVRKWWKKLLVKHPLILPSRVRPYGWFQRPGQIWSVFPELINNLKVGYIKNDIIQFAQWELKFSCSLLLWWIHSSSPILAVWAKHFFFPIYNVAHELGSTFLFLFQQEALHQRPPQCDCMWDSSSSLSLDLPAFRKDLRFPCLAMIWSLSLVTVCCYGG